MNPGQMEDSAAAVIASNQPIVIDNGSGVIKAGFAHEEKPNLIFNNYIGHPKHQKILTQEHDQQVFIGSKADQNRGLLKLSYPMEHGVVKNWSEMELIWNHIFNELKASPEEHPILLTEAPDNPLKNRDKAAAFFFESLNAPAIFFATQAVLSLYACAKSTGVVLDCGDGVTHVVPVYEGFKIPSSICRIDLGGRDVTQHLQLLLRRSGYNFTTSAQFQIVRKIKETHCYVQHMSDSSHSPGEEKKSSASSYFLPDGSEIKLRSEMSQAPQILFKPDKIGLEVPGVHEVVHDAIQKCDIDLRKTLYQTVLLAGGTTLFPGFAQRIFNHLKKKTSNKTTKVDHSVRLDRAVPASGSRTLMLAGRVYYLASRVVQENVDHSEGKCELISGIQRSRGEGTALEDLLKYLNNSKMRRKPATFDAHKSLRPLRPSSSAGKLASKPINERPAWDSTVSDLSVHKLTRAQQLNRKASVISKNRSKARQEWLLRQQKLVQNPTAQKEMIARIKPPRKPKPDPKPISYPYYYQRRLYSRDQESTSPFKAPENENPNHETHEMPRLRAAAAGSIKFTPAVISPSKKEEEEERNEAMELCAALNEEKRNQSSEKKEIENEMDRFKAKYLPEEPKSDYLDFSQNLKNLEKLKEELSQPYGSGVTPDPTPLDPLLQKYGLALNEEQDGVLSLIPTIQRDPIPQPNPLTNNALITQAAGTQQSQEAWRSNVFQEGCSTMKPNGVAESSSYGYDAYIPEPKCLGEVEEPRSIEIAGSHSVAYEETTNMKDLFFGVQKELERMQGDGGLQWSEGDAENKVKIDILGNVGEMDGMFVDDECPEEPRSYAIQQIAPLSESETLPHLAGAPGSSLSVRSHMIQFY